VKLGLGSAQFGLDYGISNRTGRTPESETRAILGVALRAGVTLLDTAPMYGASEDVLGRCARNEEAFQVVTKTLHFRKRRILREDADDLEATFHESLRRLRRESVYGLLLHNCDDGIADGGELLLERMLELTRRGLMQKFGVSVYTPEQTERVLEKCPITLVQVPFNVLDQRFERRGTLALLKAKGVEVHARSAFLQGALLMDPNELPPSLRRHRAVFQGFHSIVCAHQATSLRAALSFVLREPLIDKVIVGACSAAQFTEIVATARDPLARCCHFRDLANDDESLIDPSKWAAAAGTAPSHE
jgi:aryl-alcohol dehydrogenase-like predicted oxidoreductase